MKPEITLDDLDEVPMFSKREEFMKIFFEIHDKTKINSRVHSLRDSYLKAELIFTKRYNGRAYLSVESFQRTYYYYMNSKIIKKR